MSNRVKPVTAPRPGAGGGTRDTRRERETVSDEPPAAPTEG